MKAFFLKVKLNSMAGEADLCGDNSTSSQVSNCDFDHAQDLFGSQIPVTKGGFELRISCIQRSYIRNLNVDQLLLSYGSKFRYSKTT